MGNAAFRHGSASQDIVGPKKTDLRKPFPNAGRVPVETCLASGVHM